MNQVVTHPFPPLPSPFLPSPPLPFPSLLTPLFGLGHPTHLFQDSDSDTEGGAAGGEAESKCPPGRGQGGDLRSGIIRWGSGVTPSKLPGVIGKACNNGLGLEAAGCGRHWEFRCGRILNRMLGPWLNAHLALSFLLASGLPEEFIHPDPGPGFPEGASAG